MLNFVTWTVNPNLFDGFVTIRWYGLMFAIGFLVGYEIMTRIFKHEGHPEKWVGSMFLYVVVATIVGARLGHVFFYAWDDYKDHIVDIFKVWEGGLASHGGTLGIILAMFFYSKLVVKKSVLWSLDRLAVPVGFVAALIRLGNLFNHEIYGGPTDAPWGFCFIENLGAYMHRGAEPIFTVPCHPTQLYEATFYLITFAVCMWLYWRRNAQEREGLLLGVFLLGIFGSRFFVEFIKNVQEPWEIAMRTNWGIDQGQLLSLPFIAVALWLIVRAMRRPRVALNYPNKFPAE